MKTILLGALLFAVAGLTAGCERDGPLERAGETADDVAEEVGDRLQDSADEIRDVADDVEDEF